MLVRLVRPVSIITLSLSLAVLLQPVSLRAASPASFFSLAALLTITPDLSPLSRRVLVAEAERIWAREGVRLDWPEGHTTEAPLRVLVIPRPDASKQGAHERWPVAELVPQTGSRAIAIASIASAERVLAAGAPRLQLLASPQFSDYRLGVVLGRAVAHEIGHYLLGTAHADRGLMRAAIDAREFADPMANTFTLDEVMRVRLHEQHRHRAVN